MFFFVFVGLDNEEEIPTLKQLWTSIRQLQNDINHMKNQLSDERALRCHLQQLFINHLESAACSPKSC